MDTTWATIRGFNRYLLRLGFSPQFIGLLVGSGQLACGLAALPASAVGRRFGLRSTTQGAYVLTGLAWALLLVGDAQPRSLWAVWLFWWWAIGWIGVALVAVNNVPFAMTLVRDDERNTLFPTQQAVGVL